MEKTKIPLTQTLIEIENKKVEFLSLRREPETKVIVFIHGFNTFGAWDMLFPSYRLCKKGYSLLLPSQAGFGYSEGPRDYCGPRTVHSIGEALSQLLAKTTRVVVWGISRGAIVAGQLAAHYPNLFHAVVLQAGAYDLKMDYTWKKKPNEIKQHMFSETDGASNNAFEKRSLMHIADNITAPLLILHGEKDEIISVDQAYSMQKKMRGLGKKSELITFKEKGHHLSGPELRNEFVLPFIEKHL